MKERKDWGKERKTGSKKQRLDERRKHWMNWKTRGKTERKGKKGSKERNNAREKERKGRTQANEKTKGNP